MRSEDGKRSNDDVAVAASVVAVDDTPKCLIDTAILTSETLPEMKDIGLSFFAAACGKNRGAWVMDPPDGHTYSCLTFPEDFPKVAGALDVDPSIGTIGDANAIKNQYVAGNTTATDTIKMLNFLVNRTYESTPNKATTPYACEFSGLAKLSCEASADSFVRADKQPIRAVGLAGLFVPALWATNGKELSLDEMQDFYTLDDFKKMAKVGLNTVQISIPTAAFLPKDHDDDRLHDLLSQTLKDVETAGLQAILVLVSTADEPEAVVAAAKYCVKKGSVILGLTFPKGMTVDTTTLVDSVRVQAPTLVLFLPTSEADLTMPAAVEGENIYASMEFTHSSTIADIASSSSQEDRSKMFYHEATSCIVRSPLEFSACYRKMPAFVSVGFDLSVDNCVEKDIGSPLFQDYGQCERFEETMNSGWWHRHRKSYAARQMFAYEQGLGWSFATWKLYEAENTGVIDSPAKLLSYKDVRGAGLLPDLNSPDIIEDVNQACLNPPENDFAMGDATFAPTPGPPPDCGNGWWNYETLQCDYWIPPPPPPPTAAPTPCPDCALVCEDQYWKEEEDLFFYTPANSNNNVRTTPPTVIGSAEHSSSTTLAQAAIAGALVSLVATVAVMKMVFMKKKRNDYDAVPNMTV